MASSGPLLRMSTWHRISVGETFAYVTSTIQKRPSSNTPVSVSSYSGSCAPPAVLRHEVRVRERRVGVVVAPAEESVAGQPLQVPPALLDVLAVVALGAGQPEHPLLEDRVRPVPQARRQTQLVADIRDRPPSRPRSSGRRATGRDRAEMTPTRRRPRCSPRGPCPTPLREVGPPLVPVVGVEQVVLRATGCLGEAAVLGGVGLPRSRSRFLRRSGARTPDRDRIPRT